MAAGLRANAERLEALMPKVMRVLHRHDPDDALAEFSVPQLRMLRILTGAPHTASVVGELLGLSVSAITQMANRLEASGLIARTDDESDRRIKNLSLTLKGRGIMTRRRELRVTQAEIALAKLPEAARKQLIQSLEQLVTQGGLGKDERALSVIAELEQRLPPLEDQKK